MRVVSAAVSHVRRMTIAVAEAILLLAIFAALLFGAAVLNGGAPGNPESALAGKSGCTRNAPALAVDNNYGWGAWGSWGLAGQKIPYSIRITNQDSGCRASSFVVDLSGPDGFTVSLPTNTISLRAARQGYLWADVTSPASAADGDYQLTATARRVGGSDDAAPFATLYRVYSADSEPPTLFWPNPGDGQTVSARSYAFVASSRDDHDVKTMDLSIDGTTTTTITCDNVDYTCTLSDQLSVEPGQHTAKFRAHDWMGNVASLTVSFTTK
jgi:hypothetical protein